MSLSIKTARTPTRNVFQLKSCPRCGGDLMLDPDEDLVCLQCGRRPALPVAERDETSKNSSLRISNAQLSSVLRLLNPAFDGEPLAAA